MNDRVASSRPDLALGALCVMLGIALRLYAAMGDFWLDEIISFDLAMHAQSVISLINVRNDNNHLLNTVLMYVVGHQTYWPIYRLPAVIAGGVSIVMAGLIAKRWGRMAWIMAMALFATSHPLVHYGSEARGYSLAVMFMLTSIWAQDRALRPFTQPHGNLRWKFVLLLWTSSALGMVAHPLFLQAYSALLGWSAWVSARDRTRSVQRRCWQLVALHLVPTAFVIVMYVGHWRGMDVAGGAIRPPLTVVASSLALLIGFPHETTVTATGGAVIAGSLIVAAIAWLIRRRDSFSIVAVLTMFAIPAVMLLMLRPAVLYERYFLLPMTIALLVIASWLGCLVARGGIAGIAAMLALAAIIAANLWHDRELNLVGRGQYLSALEFMAQHTRGPTMIVGSDHDPRTVILLEFYVPYLGGQQVRYVPAERWPADDAQWFILQGRDRVSEPRREIVDRAGLHWRLAFSTDCADLSGWRWFIYQRVQDQ